MVDRLRSCYSSTWRLPDNPAVQGQYYFVPDDTEPFDSFLWSRHWRANDGQPLPTYGQDETAAEYYSKGEAPVDTCVPPWIIACAGGRYPVRLQVDMGPIGDSACDACALLGGLQTLTFVPGFCRWDGPPIAFCAGSIIGEVSYRYQLIHDPATDRTTFQLRKISGPGPTFAYFAQSFDAWAPFDAFPMTPSIIWDDACIDWPALVSINPAP